MKRCLAFYDFLAVDSLKFTTMSIVLYVLSTSLSHSHQITLTDLLLLLPLLLFLYSTIVAYHSSFCHRRAFLSFSW